MFSHSEDSSAYSVCDTKYGDVSDNTAFSAWSPYNMTNPAPYENKRSSITSVNIENTIKPKSMNYWFSSMNNLSSLDVSNIDSSSCTSMSGCFAASNLENITYGSKFVAPETIDYMFASPSTMRSSNSWQTIVSGTGSANKTVENAPRPDWYDLSKVITVNTECADGWRWTYTCNCKGYDKYIAYDFYNKNGQSWTGISFSKSSSGDKYSNFVDEDGNVLYEFTPYTNSNQLKFFSGVFQANAAKMNIEAHLDSGPPLSTLANFTMKVLLIKNV